ncbi:MAG TPA: hypothetical protein VHJ54_10950 [Solirubrobacterales bacterium]|jgi:hypothetical protein|nr:hypothetical protein [Solirubrobacterales bacterium]
MGQRACSSSLLKLDPEPLGSLRHRTCDGLGAPLGVCAERVGLLRCVVLAGGFLVAKRLDVRQQADEFLAGLRRLLFGKSSQVALSAR